MTQEATPVGGEDTTVHVEPTLEDRLSAAHEQPEEEQEEQAPQGDLPETTEGEEPEVVISEDDIEAEAAELPPIEPPISWTAEDKAKFAELPRELQETVGKREAEREKFVQSKAQEAAQAREAARTEAMAFAAQLKDEAVQHLTQYARQFEVQPPDPALITQNPEAYAQQLSTYQYAQAQREQAQSDAEKAAAERDQYQAALREQEAKVFHQRLQAELPEVFDASGQQNVAFRDQIAATAEALEYDNEAIGRASIEELKALKIATDWREKAAKYDKLMAKQMERVRAGKTLPPVSKPGVAKPAGAHRAAQYQADRQAMQKGDRDASARVFSKFL